MRWTIEACSIKLLLRWSTGCPVMTAASSFYRGTADTLTYEVRDERLTFEDIPELRLPKDMLDLASHIVKTKSGHFDPSHFEDRYENALIDLLKKKQAGKRSSPFGERPRHAW